MILFQRIFRTSFLVFFLGLMRPAHNIFKGIVFFSLVKGFCLQQFLWPCNKQCFMHDCDPPTTNGYNKQQFWHEHSNNRRIEYDQEQRVSGVNHIKLLLCNGTQHEPEIQSFLLISACFSIDIRFLFESLEYLILFLFDFAVFSVSVHWKCDVAIIPFYSILMSLLVLFLCYHESKMNLKNFHTKRLHLNA